MDISKYSKAAVLAALYNRSKPVGIGHLVPGSQEYMTIRQAETHLEMTKFFDYLQGRVIKVDLSGEVINTTLYKELMEGADKIEKSDCLVC